MTSLLTVYNNAKVRRKRDALPASEKVKLRSDHFLSSSCVREAAFFLTRITLSVIGLARITEKAYARGIKDWKCVSV